MRVQGVHVDDIWPAGLERTQMREMTYRFVVTGSTAMSDMVRELELWGVTSAEVGTTLDVNEKTGKPMWTTATAILDPSVAVRFEKDGETLVLALDKFGVISANLRAIGLTIASMRAIERHGAGQILGQMMPGLRAIGNDEDWRSVLNVNWNSDETAVRNSYRQLIRKAHPDAGGSDEEARRLNKAMDKAKREGFLK